MHQKNIFRIGLLLLLLLGSVKGVIAQKEIVAQQNAWYMYFGNHRITDKLGIHTEYQWRRTGWGQAWQQSLMRVGLDYHVAPNAMLTAGYGWIISFPYGEQPIAFTTTEHRIWEQLILSQQVGRFYFQHRYRLEQRYIQDMGPGPDGEPVVNGYNYRNRGRYRFFVAVPLSRKTLADNTLFLGLYDEVFLGFGKGIGKNILDQNRLYAALGWRFNKDVNIQAGYLNQYIVKPDGVRAERNHTFQLALTYNLDFRKN